MASEQFKRLQDGVRKNLIDDGMADSQINPNILQWVTQFIQETHLGLGPRSTSLVYRVIAWGQSKQTSKPEVNKPPEGDAVV